MGIIVIIVFFVEQPLKLDMLIANIGGCERPNFCLNWVFVQTIYLSNMNRAERYDIRHR